MYRTIAAFVIAGGLAGACASSTQYVSSWRDPTTAPFHLNHTLAVFMTTDPGMRRMVEDRLASRLPGGVPSYRLVPDNQINHIDSVRTVVAGQGFDGAVVMRLVGQQTPTNVSGTDFYGYWGYWGTAYDPISYSNSIMYTMETTLYSMRDSKLVWMARSATLDPKNADKLADNSVNFAINNMRKAGFIP
jgi:hypothetical protein